MTRPTFRRVHELRDAERLEMLAVLDANSPPEDSRRGSVRIDYRVPDIPISIEQPSGGANGFLVYGRNISRGGLGVLHGGFVHMGSKCCVVLRQVEGKPLAVRGTVSHCRLVRGAWHELGIVFEQEIDPRLILGSAVCDELKTGSAYAGESSESGVLLVSDPAEPDRLLLADRLTARGYDVVEASTPGGTLDAVQRGPTDLVLLGASTVDTQELRLIERLRETGFRQAITVLAADNSAAVMARAREAGATDLIGKPYDIDLLVAGLRMSLGQQEAGQPLHSTVLGQPGIQTHVSRYVHHVRRMGDQLKKFHETNEAEMLRKLCFELKGSGATFGFAELTVASISLLNALDRGDQPTITARVEDLAGYCAAASSADRGQQAAAA